MNSLQFNTDTQTLVMTGCQTELIAYYLEGAKAVLYDENDPSRGIIERYAQDNNVGTFAPIGSYGEYPDYENMTSSVNAITDGIILRRSDFQNKIIDDIIEYFIGRGIEMTIITMEAAVE